MQNPQRLIPKGQFPIYVRLTVNRIRTEFSTKKFIEPNRWLSEACKMKDTTEEARSINSYLNLLKSKVLDIQMELIHKNQELSLRTSKNCFLVLKKNNECSFRSSKTITIK